MKIIVRIILVVTLSIILVFVSGEMFFRFFRPQLTFREAFLKSDKCYQKSPFTPFTLIPNSECRMKEDHGDFDASAMINSFGHRGGEFSEEKQKDGKKRILVLGDSFAFGYGLSDQDTIAVKLEAFLNATGSATEVINAGFADGYGPDAYYAYLKNVGMKFAPDTVLVFLFPFNDLNDITESLWENIDKRGLPEKVTSKERIVDNGVFRFRNTDIKYEYPILRDSHLFVFTIDFFREKFKLFKPVYGTPEGSYKVGCALDPTCIDILLKQEYDIVLKTAVGMKDVAGEWGANFSVILIPADYQIYKDAIIKYIRARPVDPREPDYIQKRIGNNLKDKGIAYFDLYKTFVDATPSGYPYFPNDAHFNPLGSTIAAEAIGRYYVNNMIKE